VFVTKRKRKVICFVPCWGRPSCRLASSVDLSVKKCDENQRQNVCESQNDEKANAFCRFIRPRALLPFCKKTETPLSGLCKWSCQKKWVSF